MMQAIDVEREINTYIHEKESMGALLLSGKWGCGKTYLIKELIKKINSGEYPQAAVGVVSLFGLNNVSEIKNRVKEEYAAFDYRPATNQVARYTQKKARSFRRFTKAFHETAPDNRLAITADFLTTILSEGVFSIVDVKNTVDKDDKTIPFILVFDDFERCSGITIEDRLGVLNEYLENKQIKVIILAEEERIDDKKYNEFKEKLIARTIHLSKSDDGIISSIINNYNTDNAEYKIFLSEHFDQIGNAFYHSGYNNLRTLKACLYDFERVFSTWVKSGSPKEDLPKLFYRFCAVEYETKAGQYGHIPSPYGFRSYGISGNLSNTEKTQYDSLIEKHRQTGDKDAEKEAQELVKLAEDRIKMKYATDTFSGFSKVLSEWIVDGEWKESAYISVLKSRYEVADLSPEERFIRYDFLELQQIDIDEGLPASLKKAYSGELSCDDLISLFFKVHELRKREELPEGVEIDYPKIGESFKKRMLQIKGNVIDEPTRRIFFDKSNIDEDAVPIYMVIEGLHYKIDAWENRTELIEWLENGKGIDTAPLGMLIDEFDNTLYELSISKFISESNAGKRELCRVLMNQCFNNNVYSDEENLEHSIDNFKKLRADIESHCKECGDTITRILGKIFVEDIDKVESSLQEELAKRKDGGFLPDSQPI